MARDKDFDLRKALAQPSFTPGQRDIGALVALVATDETAAVRASPALAKLGEAARTAIGEAIAGAERSARAGVEANARAATEEIDDGGAARLVVALGLMARAGDRAARAELIARVGDARVRVRRAAIVALGKLGATRSTRADQRDDLRRDDAPTEPGDDASNATRGDASTEQRDDASNATRGDASNATRGDATRTKRDDASSVRQATEGARRPMVDLREAVRRDDDRRGDDKPPLVDLRETERRGDDRRVGEPDDDVRAALIARWDASDVPADERRALAEALGKIGGTGVRARLEALDAASDKELARRRDRALLVADREEKRGEDSEVIVDRAPPRPLVVRLGCRPALAELLIAEARAAGFDGKAVRDDAVDVPLAGAWKLLFESRLWATAAIRIEDRGLRQARGDRQKVTDAIVRAVVSDEMRGLMRAWTRGPIRWRLSLARGHQRAVVWTVAKEVTRRAPELVNDPTQTTWDIRVDDEEGVLELVPRRASDPRFAYRVAEVPAASHPSVAAAVVWLAGIERGERVWDPFCGSGLELAEAALRGAGSLVGSDLDEEALVAARSNLEAAGVAIDPASVTSSPGGPRAPSADATSTRDVPATATEAYGSSAAPRGVASPEQRSASASSSSTRASIALLARGDARTFAPGPVDAIVTNPPLGSRVHVDAGALLVEALPHFTKLLRPGGRLVWITPQWRRTTPAAEAQGLVLVRSLFVDLGGVRGRLERWDRRR